MTPLSRHARDAARCAGLRLAERLPPAATRVAIEIASLEVARSIGPALGVPRPGDLAEIVADAAEGALLEARQHRLTIATMEKVI